MMRSLYSGVSGLKVHQTKMDVIGNNIANVNTVGFKGSSVTFSDIFYQTTASASGPNRETGLTGRNAIQVGLGANLAAISTNIAVQGGSQRTDNPFDVMLSGDGFFIVSKGGTNYFTKSGAFKVDGGGTLCTPDGASVMGWQVGQDGNILRAGVSPLRIMSPENLYAEPEATTQAYVTGNIDKMDSQLSTATGFPAQVSFYDNLGNSYTLKMAVKKLVDTSSGVAVEGQYTVTIDDIVDTKDSSIFAVKKADGTYEATGYKFKFGADDYTATVDQVTGAVTLAATGSTPVTMCFNPSSGDFIEMLNNGMTGGTGGTGGTTGDKGIVQLSITRDSSGGTGTGTNTANTFPTDGLTIDFSSVKQYATNEVSKLESAKGSLASKGPVTGAGLPVGNMTGISIDSSGKIYGTYNNGTNKLLGQIAVATFANPSGLEAVGNNMFAQTKNSGEFDGVGEDPTQGGGSLTTGVLEMSNVDLSTEFTSMITTQRGFQANSRIITTSDTLLEELINLKR